MDDGDAQSEYDEDPELRRALDQALASGTVKRTRPGPVMPLPEAFAHLSATLLESFIGLPETTEREREFLLGELERQTSVHRAANVRTKGASPSFRVHFAEGEWVAVREGHERCCTWTGSTPDGALSSLIDELLDLDDEE